MITKWINLDDNWHASTFTEGGPDIYCKRCKDFVTDVDVASFKCHICNLTVPEDIIKKFNFMFPDDTYKLHND